MRSFTPQNLESLIKTKPQDIYSQFWVSLISTDFPPIFARFPTDFLPIFYRFSTDFSAFTKYLNKIGKTALKVLQICSDFAYLIQIFGKCTEIGRKSVGNR